MKTEVETTRSETEGESGVILREIDIGNDMVLAEVRLEKLRDADMNARVMARTDFDILTDNIRRRGKLESVLYCAQPKGVGPITIISGHNRRKAALAANVQTAWVLIDRAEYTRSQLVAKQLAHNALVGVDDQNILAEMVKLLDNADDLLASGIKSSEVPIDQKYADVALLTPTLEFEQKTLAFAFLPHQFAEAEKFFGEFDKTVDMMVVGHESQWEEFVAKAAAFSRIKNIRSGATAIAQLIRIAQAEIDEYNRKRSKEAAEQSLGATEPDPRNNERT